MPSMRGISISSVITSGLSVRILSRATNGSGAVPTTSISASLESDADSIFLTMAESSTTRTRIFAPVPTAFTLFIGSHPRVSQVPVPHSHSCVQLAALCQSPIGEFEYHYHRHL